MPRKPDYHPTIRCAECWNRPDLTRLHDEEIEAIEAQGANYVCEECLEAALEEDRDDWREHSTYHVRNGSVVG